MSLRTHVSTRPKHPIDIGELDEDDIEFDGESHLRGFNPAFVNETLSSISTTSFRLYGTDPLTPGHFTPDGDADEDYIVMPMRVS